MALRQFIAAAILLTAAAITATAEELWNHLNSPDDFSALRGVTARVDDSGDARVVTLTISELSTPLGVTFRNPRRGIAWADIPAPDKGWNLERAATIRTTITNTGSKPATVTLWVAASHGWAAVGSETKLAPGKTTTLSAKLRETYPDGTPKIDPHRINRIRIMVQGTDTATLELRDLTSSGTAAPWTPPHGQLEVPELSDGKPAPGHRVRYRLPGDSDEDIYGTLYLPTDWKPGQRYPVIVEYPGNHFFKATACWSTGCPEQCVMGYGITHGTGATWVSLPYVDRPNGTIAEYGFGSNNGADTAAHLMAVVDDLCENWGGDRDRLFLSGFSRGAIGCGYIGLRDDKIAALWKGFIACQHYDGSGWGPSQMDGAVRRAPRFKGTAIAQIDNSPKKYQAVVDATNPQVKWTWLNSGLGYHATAMFLDDRPSMQELRKWFREVSDPEQ